VAVLKAHTERQNRTEGLVFDKLINGRGHWSLVDAYMPVVMYT